MALKIRYFCLVLCCCLSITGSALAETSDSSPERPQCSSPALYQKAMQAVADYTATLPAASTLAKRRKALISVNIEGFSDVPTEGFSVENDFNTANALITIKINKKIAEKEIVICRQNTQKKQPLYLLLFPENEHFRGYILNLDEYSNNIEDISFVYP